MPRYRVNRGLTYPENYRANRENWRYKSVEPGEIVDDIPPVSRDWLLDRGHIEPVDADPEPDESGEEE